MKNTLTPDDQIALAQQVQAFLPDEAEMDYLDLLDYLAIPGFALTTTSVEDHEAAMTETVDRISEDHERKHAEAVAVAFSQAEVYIFNELADLENWQMLASRAYFQILTGRPIPLEECLA